MEFQYEKKTRKNVVMTNGASILLLLLIGIGMIVFSIFANPSITFNRKYITLMGMLACLIAIPLSIYELLWVFIKLGLNKDGISIKYPLFKKKMIYWKDIRVCQLRKNDKLTDGFVTSSLFQTYGSYFVFAWKKVNFENKKRRDFYHPGYSMIYVFTESMPFDKGKCRVIDCECDKMITKLNEWNVNFEDLREV